MHLTRCILARGALRRRALRAARPCILDPRHRCGGLGRGGLRRSFLIPTWFAVWLALRFAVAATMIAAAMVALAMTFMAAGATIACTGGRLALGSCRRLAHP